MALYAWWTSKDVLALALFIIVAYIARKNEPRIRRLIERLGRLIARIHAFMGPIPSRISMSCFLATLMFIALVANDQVAEVHFKDTTYPGYPSRRVALTRISVEPDATRRFVEFTGVVEAGHPRCRNRRNVMVLAGPDRRKVVTFATRPDGSFAYAWAGPRVEVVFRALRQTLERPTHVTTCAESTFVVRESELGRFRGGAESGRGVIPRMPDPPPPVRAADPPETVHVPVPARPDPDGASEAPAPARPDPERPRQNEERSDY